MEYLLWFNRSTISVWETLFELSWWTLSVYCRLEWFWNILSHESNATRVEPFLGSWRINIWSDIWIDILGKVWGDWWLKLNSVNNGRTSELRVNLRQRWWDAIGTEIVCVTNAGGVNQSFVAIWGDFHWTFAPHVFFKFSKIHTWFSLSKKYRSRQI